MAGVNGVVVFIDDSRAILTSFVEAGTYRKGFALHWQVSRFSFALINCILCKQALGASQSNQLVCALLLLVSRLISKPRHSRGLLLRL